MAVRKKKAVSIVALLFGAVLGTILLAPTSVAVTVVVPFVPGGIVDADLDGDPATGSWGGSVSAIVPLENGGAAPYGTATAYFEHNGASLYVRVDGHVDVPWVSAAGNHFWFGFLIGPETAPGHHNPAQDSVFFGDTSYPGTTYPLTPVDASGSGKPPARDAQQDAIGSLRVTGASPPYAFTAEWRRPLNTHDPQDVFLIADGRDAYAFALTTDSNGGGSAGGALDHAAVTNDNVLRLAKPSTSDTTPPQVTITSPQNATAVEGTATVDASATDDVAVCHIDFLVDGKVAAIDMEPPWEYAWDTMRAADGSHVVGARAYDTSFNNATATVTVVVTNPDSTPPIADAGPDQVAPPGTAVRFDGSASADNKGVVNWTWSFTDVTPATVYREFANYTFARKGAYLVALTVRDAAGLEGRDLAWVNVSDLVDWAAEPSISVTTTEGGAAQTANVQTAVAAGLLFFHANFTYQGDVGDPDGVYFAVEFDRAGTSFPMSAGDEMIIASRHDPTGATARGFSYYVAENQRTPQPLVPSPAQLLSYEVRGSRYEIVFYRPLNATDAARQVDLTPGASVKVAFAVGQWGRGSAHAYTLMAWRLDVSAGGAVMVEVGGTDAAAVYRLAASLGPLLVLFSVLLVAFHAVRRRIWRRVHPVEALCGASGKVEVARHSRGVRVAHWTHVGLMFTFIATGYSLVARSPVLGSATVPVHVAASVLILTADFPVRFFFLWRSKELSAIARPRKEDLRITALIIANFFGLTKKYPEHATVDPARGGWFADRKYCTLQKGMFALDLAAIVGMAVTGYALYAPSTFAWLYGTLGYYGVRATHLILFYYFVATLIAHAYLSFIPMNWGKLASMVRGRGKVNVHREAAPSGPEPPASSASGTTPPPQG